MGRPAMSGREVYAIHAACIRGVEAFPVTVEVSMAEGIPGITIVGMPDSTVLEARSRIRCALRSTSFEIPRKSITVNLSPSDKKRQGPVLTCLLPWQYWPFQSKYRVKASKAASSLGRLHLTAASLPPEEKCPIKFLLERWV